LLDAYPAEFRQRVLRRVAASDDLDATAREFGVRADLVSQWLKDSAERNGTPVGSFRKASESASSDGPARASRGDWGDAAPIYVVLLLPALLLFAVGHVLPSAQAQRDCLPVWIAMGAALLAWQVRRSNRRLEARGIDLPATHRLAIAALFAVLSGLSTWILALALPAIPHRLIAKTIEVRTVVTGKVVLRGKGTTYCLRTPPFDSRLGLVRWCTDSRTFAQAQEGETIVLHGSTSWFGFMRDHFELVPSVPASASGVAGAGSPIQAQSPPMTLGGPARFKPAPQIPAGARKPLDPGPAEPVDHRRSPLPDEPLHAWPGDDLAKIQAAYPGSPAPLPFHSGDPANQQSLWLQDRGLRFFLTSGGTVNTVRLDRPFAGAVNGVRLGDALDAVRRSLGSSGSDLGARPRGALANSYLFETQAGYRIRVDLDADQRVRTILLLR
jgi:hypothetical protein